MDIDSYCSVFDALADRNRLKIIDCLEDKEMSVSGITEELDLEQSKVSHHLKCLRNCGFVKRRKNGNKRIYSRRDDSIESIFSEVQNHIENCGDRVNECSICG